MRTSLRTHRTLLGLAAALLIATAGLHATGLGAVSQTLAQSEIPAEWTPVFQGLWLMFSIHLVIIAGLLVVLAVVPVGRLPVAVAAAMPIADTVLLLVAVGIFVGSIMTGLAATLCLAALVTMPTGCIELEVSSRNPG